MYFNGIGFIMLFTLIMFLHAMKCSKKSIIHATGIPAKFLKSAKKFE